MINDFKKIIDELINSKEYSDFKIKNKDYYLAHGFVQLNANFTLKSNWQIGFYSPKKDNLAVFETNPIKLLPFEKAFKKDGEISELKNIQNLKTTNEILELLKIHHKKKYLSQIPSSYLIIVQIIENIPVYNITTITTSFSMINIRFNALTGEIILDECRSILDLRNGN